MTQASLTEAGASWMSIDSAKTIVREFRASKQALIAVDGFMGSGKSPFASMLEWCIGRQCLRLDRYLRTAQQGDQSSYVNRLDLAQVANSLREQLKRGAALVEGVLVRDVLSRLDVVPEKDIFHVYVAGAWKPDNMRVTWPDEAQLDSKQGQALYAEIVEYHGRRTPHRLFDALVLRNQDEPEATGTFMAPDGQCFVISDEAWPRKDIQLLRVNSYSFVCNDKSAKLEPLGLIRPPRLSASTRGLSADRLRSVLQAIRSGNALPPVPVIREEGQPYATLLDGAHRYFGSVATGLVEMPVQQTSKEEAELRYRYVASPP